MASKTLYGVLGLPASATGLEIRAAYQVLIAHVRAGEIPPEQAEALEKAYAILGNPVHRLQYDIQVTAPSLPEREPAAALAGPTPARVDQRRRRSTDAVVAATPPAPSRAPVKLPRWRWDSLLLMDVRVPMAVMAGLVVAGIAVILLLPRSSGTHPVTAPAQPITGRAVAPVATPAAVPNAAAAIVSSSTPDAVAPPASPQETPDLSSQPVPASAPAPAVLALSNGAALPRASAIESFAGPAPRPLTAVFVPQAALPEAEVPQAEVPQAETSEPELASAPSVAPASASLGPTIAALEQFLPGASNAAFQRRVASASLAGHLNGQYCHDSSGGEVFLPGGAPVPSNLRCQG